MSGLEQFLSNPLVWKIVGGYYLFNAAVSPLPPPNGNKFYRWLYGFLHTLAGNMDKVAGALKVPGAN